ncbi:MAG: alkaline phosphatase D family protein [Sphingomonadales bacterium]|nr:alkaline phosphatase D family protein [Sphingomonadales bacterium]
MTAAPPPAPFGAATRRGLLKIGALGLAGLGAPLHAADRRRGFSHGVASGEPGPDRVLLWTRYAADADTALQWQVSTTSDFARTIAAGDVTASPVNDCCAKAWATGLAPGQWYYYRFIAPGGAVSDVGRTRTLPVGKVPAFRIAVFSCSNYGFGFFNAYAHAAEQGDFDLTMHLGDYFYEYHRGEYPSAKQTVGDRIGPVDEAITLAGYRERFATYRADPDLQRVHQLYPMIAMWDDHETANDTWAGGAENHQPDEGDWATRKAASEKAYREWMPVGDEYFTSYELGDLATLFKLESRHLARSEQLDLLGAFKAAQPGQGEAALAAFRDGAWRAADRTLLGPTQEAWLASALKTSVRTGKPWQVLGQEVVMGSLALPDGVMEGLPAKAPDWLRQRLSVYLAAAHDGLPFNMDSWDGYPAARDRLYRAALEAHANLVVLSGDSHNAWAFDLDRKGQRVGVEMGGHSVTSPGAEDSLPWKKPDDLAGEIVARNPQLKWCDTARRGYMAVDLTPAAASCEWRFMASVKQRGTALSGVRRMTVLAGQRKYRDDER